MRRTWSAGPTRLVRRDRRAHDWPRFPLSGNGSGNRFPQGVGRCTRGAPQARDKVRACRYGARPPFSLERFRKLPRGRIGYRIKKARGGRAKLLVLTPIELLARIAALIPPPRYPLVRYHGVLAPRSSWRKAVIPRPPEIEGTREQKKRHEHGKGASPNGQREGDAHSSRRDDDANRLPKRRAHAASGASDFPATYLAPNVIAVRHWERLRGGMLLATAPRIPWSVLLRRTFDVDVLECAKCHGRLRVFGAVDDPALVRALLEELSIPTRNAPAQARARDPSTLEGDDPTDDREE